MFLEDVPELCVKLGINAKVINGACEVILDFCGSRDWPNTYIMASKGHAVPLIPKSQLLEHFG